MVSLTECLLLQVKSRIIIIGSVCHARCFPAMIKYFSSFIIGLSKFSNKTMVLWLFYTVPKLFSHTEALNLVLLVQRNECESLPFFRPVLILKT